LGLVGFGSNNARGAMDNITVQVLPPEATVTKTEDFTGPGNSLFSGVESDVRRLLTSLVENAVEHAPPGGNVKIHVFQSREWKNEHAEGLKIVVSDDGPGIPAESRSRIFEPFFRASTDTEGTGLGLAIVREIADAHAGNITLDTGEGGKGVHMHVSFPRAAAAVHSRAA